jgi:hypothetical protein
MGLGHKRRALNAISITYKEEELIIGGSARSLSDDPYAEHRILQPFCPAFNLIGFDKDVAIIGKYGHLALSLHAGNEFRASACGNQIAALSIMASSLQIRRDSPKPFATTPIKGSLLPNLSSGLVCAMTSSTDCGHMTKTPACYQVPLPGSLIIMTKQTLKLRSPDRMCIILYITCGV